MNISKLKNISLFLLMVFIGSIFSCKKIDINHISKIYTDSITISGTSITAFGKIVDIADNGMLFYGFCWSTNKEPTVFNSKIEYSNASQTGQFSSAIKNLSANIIYYIRTFASDGDNYIYGNTLSFSIVGFNDLLVITNPVNILSTSSVSVGGGISGLGSISIQDCGHCWSTQPNPTISNNKTSYGSLLQDSSFNSTLTNLDLITTYYVRSYAKIDASTIIYGNEQSYSIPDLVVRTDTFSYPNSTNITLKGTILVLGVNKITDHGFCWSTTTSQPNLNNNVISLGTTSSIGQFGGPLNNITVGIKYYYRAYATDGIYVKYGIIKQFTK